jgi:hypothetical protein
MTHLLSVRQIDAVSVFCSLCQVAQTEEPKTRIDAPIPFVETEGRFVGDDIGQDRDELLSDDLGMLEMGFDEIVSTAGHEVEASDLLANCIITAVSENPDALNEWIVGLDSASVLSGFCGAWRKAHRPSVEETPDELAVAVT